MQAIGKNILRTIYLKVVGLISSNSTLKFLNFKVTQFLAMRGIANPIVKGLQANYWQSRTLDTNHSPDIYTEPDETTYALLDDLLKVTTPENSFLEIGCNSGRNLKYLYDKGYKKLGGIEINPVSINKVLKEKFPDLYRDGDFYVGNAADEIEKVGDQSYDVVFSNAVLVHIEAKDKKLFDHMARVSRKYIAILTNENPSNSQPYKFQQIFEGLGYKMVHYQLFFGEDTGDCLLPIELYNKEKHFYDGCFIRIFIKNAS